MLTDEEASLTEPPGRAARARRRGLRWWLFALSGLVPLLGLLGGSPDPTPLIYSACVLIWLALPPRAAPASGWRFVITITAAGLALECLAWLNNFLKCAPAPALLHPQLLPDLTLALAFYSAWGLAWLLLLRFFRFSAREVFVTQGLFGVFVEQQGAIFMGGLASMPLGLVLWLYVFVVYGSVAGIAARVAGLPGRGARSPRWKHLLALLVVAAVLWPTAFAWGALMQGAGLIPPRGPICVRPLR